MIKDSTPGISSGYGIMDSLVSGESPGISSLDKETIQSLRKTADSTHALGVKGACAGSVSDDTPNIHNYTVGCPPAKKASGKRVSIRKIN